MAPVECSVPDCDYVTPENLTRELALSHLTLQTQAVHLINQPAAPAAVVSKLKKLPRPVFSLNMTKKDWQSKEIDWNSYIEQTPCSENAKLAELIAACDDSLIQKVRDSGGCNLHTVPLLLDRIKELAVEKKQAVLVQEFLSESQARDEEVRQYFSRLRDLATKCDFTVECDRCPNVVSYSDKIIEFKLIGGLSNEQIQDIILTTKDKTWSLKKTVKEIEAQESGKLSRANVNTNIVETDNIPIADDSDSPNPAVQNLYGEGEDVEEDTSVDQQRDDVGGVCSQRPPPKVRRNRQQVKGELGPDGWTSYEIKKDGEVALMLSRKEVEGKGKFRCDQPECRVGL